MESNLVEFALEILGKVSHEEIKIESKCELLRLAQNVSKTDLGSFRSVNHQLTSLTTDLLIITKPTIPSFDVKLLTAFHKYFAQLSPEVQRGTYSYLGSLINSSLKRDSTKISYFHSMKI